MARIRTIKPEFFRHEGLFEAERDEGLPLRVAFAGIWTACDREGRFRWAPRQLKLDCLPYDEIDFSRVLDALRTRGFIAKYVVDGKEYGFIPSWREHQFINNREVPSILPNPSENNILLPCEHRVLDACSTRQSNYQGEGKGKEGEGKGKENQDSDANASPKNVPDDPLPTRIYAFVGKTIRLRQADLDRWRGAYSAIPDFTAALQAADDYYSEHPPKDGKWFFPVSRWLEKQHTLHFEKVRAENGRPDRSW